MQFSIAHSIPVLHAESVGWLPSFIHKIATYGWTMLATSGVILTAAYMLWMIQRVFYGSLGIKSETVAGWDLDAREHVALWPLVALFLLMGVCSPLWTKAIDTFGVAAANGIDRAQTSPEASVTAPLNPCDAILPASRRGVLDVNYDKRHHTAICNADGSFVHPDGPDSHGAIAMFDGGQR